MIKSIYYVTALIFTKED